MQFIMTNHIIHADKINADFFYRTDADLQKAIEESEKEARESERKKREALERENQNNLFGSNSQQV